MIPISAIAIAGAVGVSSIPMLMSGKEVSLYFHIPFCTKKCDYCHFYVIPDKVPHKALLLEGLALEWQHWLAALQNFEVVSIYFGGGTPSLFGPEPIAKVINWVKASTAFDPEQIEITLEANPENIDLSLMREYSDAGINRVSLGIQSFDDSLLKHLGRIHLAQRGIEAVYLTHEAGIHNISIDLMYDLPRQTMESWQNSLLQAISLPITHLSLYNLTIEPHTVFFKYRSNLEPLLPDAETSLAMYQAAIDNLSANGFTQYEISAFARGNCYSRHNVGYWIGRPFLGYGPSAFSYWEGKRFRNIANLNRYVQQLKQGLSPIDFEEKLDPLAQRRELLALHLRLCSGVNLKQFQKDFGELEATTIEILEHLKKQELLMQEKEVLRLTKQGILFYDSIATEVI